MALSKTLRRYRGWIATITLVAVGVSTYLLYQRSQTQVSRIAYSTEQVQVGTISVTVSATGNLALDGATDVYSPVSGEVNKVDVAEGSTVTTGTVLFTLEPATAEAATARALAGYRQSQHQVAQAEAQLARAGSTLAELSSRSAEPSATASSSDLAAAEADVGAAKAGLASAQAAAATAYLEYKEIKAAESDLTVTSPCSGIVWSLNVATGATVAAASGASGSSTNVSAGSTAGESATVGTTTSSAAPVVIAPEQPLAAHLTVNEVDVASLALGQRAAVELDALPDLAVTGKVYEISEEGTNSQGVVTFDVWVSLDVADSALRAGMSAAATIVTDMAADALIVPNAAVKADSRGESYVEVLSESAETPRRTAIETGLVSATQTQVLSGLAEGDVVVTQTVEESESEKTSGSQQPPAGMMIPDMGGGPRG